MPNKWRKQRPNRDTAEARRRREERERLYAEAQQVRPSDLGVFTVSRRDVVTGPPTPDLAVNDPVVRTSAGTFRRAEAEETPDAVVAGPADVNVQTVPLIDLRRSYPPGQSIDRRFAEEVARRSAAELERQVIRDGLERVAEVGRQRLRSWADICTTQPLVVDNEAREPARTAGFGLVVTNSWGTYPDQTRTLHPLETVGPLTWVKNNQTCQFKFGNDHQGPQVWWWYAAGRMYVRFDGPDNALNWVPPPGLDGEPGLADLINGSIEQSGPNNAAPVVDAMGNEEFGTPPWLASLVRSLL